MDKFGIFNLNDLYKEGVCKKLDKRIRDYQKVRIWHGLAASYALTEKENDLMGDLWRKEKLRRNAHDVQRCVHFNGMVILI